MPANGGAGVLLPASISRTKRASKGKREGFILTALGAMDMSSHFLVGRSKYDKLERHHRLERGQSHLWRRSGIGTEFKRDRAAACAR